MWVDVSPVTADVEPGAEATVELIVRNTGDVVEEYHLQATGDPAKWAIVEPQTLRLYPGTTGTAQITFSPPRSSEAQAGPQSYAVKVTPREDRDNTFAIEGVLRVAEFADIRAELMPVTARGWHRGRVKLAVDNYSNAAASASVSTGSSNSTLQVDIRTPALRLQPGRAQFSKFSVRPGRLLWFGTKARHQYNVTVTPSGVGQPVTLQGTFMQSALLPLWLQRLVMFGVAGAAAVLALWFAIHPSFASAAQASPKPAAASGPQVIVIQPTPSAPPSTPTPSPTPTPPKPSTSQAPPPQPSASHAAPPPAASTSKLVAPPPSSSSTGAVGSIKTANILNFATNQSVDLYKDNFVNGQQVETFTTLHNDAQSWSVWLYDDQPTVDLVIQSTGKPDSAGTKVLEIDPNNPANVIIADDTGGVQGLQAKMVADYQEWNLTNIPNKNGYGVLKNRHTGTCLAANGQGQWLTAAPCNTGDQNQWFWLFAL